MVSLTSAPTSEYDSSAGRGRRARLRAADRHRPVVCSGRTTPEADQLHQRARLASPTPRPAAADRDPRPVRQRHVPPGAEHELDPELAVRGQQQLQPERPEPRRRRPARLLGRVPRLRHRRRDPAGGDVQRCRRTRRTRAQFYWINSIDVGTRPRRPPSPPTRSRSPAAVRSRTTPRPTVRPTRATSTAPRRSRTASTRRSRRARSCGSRPARST